MVASDKPNTEIEHAQRVDTPPGAINFQTIMMTRRSRRRSMMVSAILLWLIPAVSAAAEEDPPPQTMEQCNADIDNIPCKLWSQIFGNQRRHTKRIHIVCGTCITLDYQDPYTAHDPHLTSVLELAGGMTIEGKLVIPDHDIHIHNLRLETSFIDVLAGEFHISSTHNIAGDPSIDISGPVNIQDPGMVVWNGAPKDAPGSVPVINVASSDAIPENLRRLETDESSPYSSRTKTKRPGCRQETSPSNSAENFYYEFPDVLVVPNTISGSWEKGADIVLTMAPPMLRTIEQVAPHPYNKTLSLLYLDQCLLERPNLLKIGNEPSVRVALLSRNILLRNDLTIRSNNARNVLTGIELREATIIIQESSAVTLSNSVTHNSKHGCISVANSRDIHLVDNVGFDCDGSCFESRDSQSIEWKHNIGISTLTSGCTFDTYDSSQLDLQNNIAVGSKGFGYSLRNTKDVTFRHNVASSHAMAALEISSTDVTVDALLAYNNVDGVVRKSDQSKVQLVRCLLHGSVDGVSVDEESTDWLPDLDQQEPCDPNEPLSDLDGGTASAVFFGKGTV